MVFFMTEAFKLVMAVMTLPAFPVSIMGTIVNKKCRYSLYRKVSPNEDFLYRYWCYDLSDMDCICTIVVSPY